MVTVGHIVEHHIQYGWPIYSWYGETAFIGSIADELERVNVFRALPMHVVEHDSVNDIAILKVTYLIWLCLYAIWPIYILFRKLIEISRIVCFLLL